MSRADTDTEAPLTPRLNEALRQARLAESAHFEAALDIRDAKTLRLAVLLDEVRPHLLAGRREADGFIDPVLVPGEPPRLWIDMVASVVMEPDPQTYRFQRDTAGGREILLESRNRRELIERIIAYVAHRLVERERQFASDERGRARAPGGYGGTALLLAWLSGFSVGILALFALGVWLAKSPL
jgi:hypothetical protein